MAEKEACSEFVEKTIEENQTGNVQGESLLLPLLQGVLDAPEIEQTQDSGTESGEDLRSGLIVEVQNALDKLSACLCSDSTDITAERRDSLLQLVTKLQANLCVPNQSERRLSGQNRFARRRQRQNRHTVGVTSEELEDARRLMEEIALRETIQFTNPLQKQNSESSVQSKPATFRPVKFQPHQPIKNAMPKPFTGSTNTTNSQSHSESSPTIETPTTESLDLLYSEKPDDSAYFENATIPYKQSVSLDHDLVSKPNLQPTLSLDYSQDLKAIQLAVNQAAILKTINSEVNDSETDDEATMHVENTIISPNQLKEGEKVVLYDESIYQQPDLILQSNPLYTPESYTQNSENNVIYNDKGIYNDNTIYNDKSIYDDKTIYSSDKGIYSNSTTTTNPKYTNPSNSDNKYSNPDKYSHNKYSNSDNNYSNPKSEYSSRDKGKKYSLDSKNLFADKIYSNSNPESRSNELRSSLYESFEDKANKFNTKKLKMKRANTIDIPKPLNYYQYDDDDEDSDTEASKRRSNYLALRGPIRVGKTQGGNVVPTFEPKTESDKKFLAFINKHNENTAVSSKITLWDKTIASKATDPGTNWQKKFGNIKTNFEVGGEEKKSVSSARNFWKSADDAVAAGTLSYNGPKISRQNARNLQQMFEQKQKASQPKPKWSEEVVTGNLKVEPHKNYKFVPQPLTVNKFSHNPQSAFKPIQKATPNKASLKTQSSQSDSSNPETPLYLYSPKSFEFNTQPTAPWSSTAKTGERRVLSLAASKFENPPVEEPKVKPKKVVTKEKIVIPTVESKEKLPSYIAGVATAKAGGSVRKLSGQYDNITNKEVPQVKHQSAFASVPKKSEIYKKPQAQAQKPREQYKSYMIQPDSVHKYSVQPDVTETKFIAPKSQPDLTFHSYPNSYVAQNQSYPNSQYQSSSYVHPELSGQYQANSYVQTQSYIQPQFEAQTFVQPQIYVQPETPSFDVDVQPQIYVPSQTQIYVPPQTQIYVPPQTQVYVPPQTQIYVPPQTESQSYVQPQIYVQPLTQTVSPQYQSNSYVSPPNEPQTSKQPQPKSPNPQMLEEIPASFHTTSPIVQKMQQQNTEVKPNVYYNNVTNAPSHETQRPKYDSQASIESLHEYNAINSKVMTGPVSQLAVTVTQAKPKSRNEHDMDAALKSSLQRIEKSKSPQPKPKSPQPKPKSPKPTFYVNDKSLNLQSLEINERGESVITSKFQIPVQKENKLTKCDSWHQICQDAQTLNKPSPRASPNARAIMKSKSTHTLALPKQFEAGMSRDEMVCKKKTMEAYFQGSKSPVLKRRAVNRVKTTEKISTERVETTRKTFTEGPLTTTQVSTRVTSQQQITKKPMSPFAKFRQLDKQNSVNTPPSTPKTPTSGGPMFKFTDPNLSRSASTIKERLLQWCQMKTKEYENIKLDNFSTSWADGLAFCALVHHFLPDAFDYHKLTPNNRRYNFTLAFQVADEKADIAPLLDVDDMVATRRPDWKCVFTYVQSIYRRFKDED